MTDDKNNKTPKPAADGETTKEPLYDMWPEEGVQDILDYIEEQGIYIRE